MKKGASIVAATQNFRGGLRDEEKIEEMILQMRRQCINIVCGQESGLANEFAVKRWDTGEMLISCGKNGSNRKKAAGCYFLDAEMAEAYIKGGSKMTRHGDRLSTIESLLIRGIQYRSITVRLFEVLEANTS